MGDFFANLRSGIQFPQVIMNQQGPLPGMGGLPRPLHDTADGRINYNSSLLGDLTPYAYGEPGYLSSQTAYLNIPHKIQKIVPEVFLPEGRMIHSGIIGLSHPVDDGDLAFTLRLDRNSLFCTGVRSGSRRAATGTAIDPLINLATVNYILAGVQMEAFTNPALGTSLWRELLQNLDPRRFGELTKGGEPCVVSLDDIIHIVKHCIRPFGIVRGSEKQGGQNEATASPATWPVCFVASVTLDGKESNVMNLWHHLSFSAGEDLVLGLKLMPLRSYTLNHYYKGIKQQSFSDISRIASRVKAKDPTEDVPEIFVWQLCPNVMSLDLPTDEEADAMEKRLAALKATSEFKNNCRTEYTRGRGNSIPVTGKTPWQDLGYWHIGRTQIMSGKYGVEEYWHNDNANCLRTNHLDLTLQPMFLTPPRPKAPPRGRPALFYGRGFSGTGDEPTGRKRVRRLSEEGEDVGRWEPKLRLERLPPAAAPAPPSPQPPPRRSFVAEPSREREEVADEGHEAWDRMLGLGPPPVAVAPPPLPVSSAAAVEEEDIGTFAFVFDEPSPPAPAPPLPPPSGTGIEAQPEPGKKSRRGGGKRSAGGSLLRADGSTERGLSVGML
jgi:hypothetical protein